MVPVRAAAQKSTAASTSRCKARAKSSLHSYAGITRIRS